MVLDPYPVHVKDLFFFTLQICTDHNILKPQLSLPFTIFRVSKPFLAVRATDHGLREPGMATTLQLAAASPSWFQTASVKKLPIQNTCSAVKPRPYPRRSTLGPFHHEPEISLRIRPCCAIKMNWGFSCIPVPDLSPGWIPFFKVCSWF